jgi:hypothetical protein
MTNAGERKSDNQWTIDSLHHHLSEKIEALDQRIKLLREADNDRYQQRFEAQEKAVSKVNEIREVVSDFNKETMQRSESEQRFRTIEEKLTAEADRFLSLTNLHFQTNGAEIKRLQDWVAQQRGRMEHGEKTSNVTMWIITTTIGFAVAIASVCGTLIFRK